MKEELERKIKLKQERKQFIDEFRIRNRLEQNMTKIKQELEQLKQERKTAMDNGIKDYEDYCYSIISSIESELLKDNWK